MGRPAGPPTEGDVPKALVTLVGVDPARARADAKPPGARWLGIPFSGVVSVILRGIPLDLSGTVGAGFFFILF